MRRIDAARDVYETWPIETRQAILDGKVEPGMTPKMVEVAWGKPTEVVNGSANNEEIWVYRSGGYDPSLDPAMMGGGVSGPNNSIGITTGGGATTIGSSTNMGIGGMGGMGGGMGGMGGMGGGSTLPRTPVEEKEVIFRDGVVHRADAP